MRRCVQQLKQKTLEIPVELARRRSKHEYWEYPQSFFAATVLTWFAAWGQWDNYDKNLACRSAAGKVFNNRPFS
jgi:hypothetical protein